MGLFEGTQPRPQGLLLDDFRRSAILKIVEEKALGTRLGGTQVKTNMEEFSEECRSVDSSGDGKVLTELQIAIRSRL